MHLVATLNGIDLFGLPALLTTFGCVKTDDVRESRSAPTIKSRFNQETTA